MTHPGDKELALLSGGDLTGAERVRVWWHVRGCERCRREMQAVQADTVALRSAVVDIPPAINWDRLAAEMTANIHLGLEAGECVGSVEKRKTAFFGWRPVAAMAGMMAVLTVAWWLNPPRQQGWIAAKRSPVEIRTSPTGLEVKENGSALILMHTRGQQAPIIVSTPGSLRARYVDQDTGQVTINNVYAD